jgi:hypothetical protein
MVIYNSQAASLIIPHPTLIHKIEENIYETGNGGNRESKKV